MIIAEKNNNFIKRKEMMIENNQKWVKWLQSEVDNMTAWNMKSADTMRKIATYKYDIKRRKARIEKHKNDIQLGGT